MSKNYLKQYFNYTIVRNLTGWHYRHQINASIRKDAPDTQEFMQVLFPWESAITTLFKNAEDRRLKTQWKCFHHWKIVCIYNIYLHKHTGLCLGIQPFTKSLMQFKTWVTQDVRMIVANCKQYIYSSNPSPLIEHGDDHESNLWSHSTTARKCELENYVGQCLVTGGR